MKIYKFFALVALVLGFTGCNDFLDQPQPAQSLPSSSALERASDLETALVGAYNFLQDGTGGNYHVNIEMLANIMSDNGDWRGSFPSYIEAFNRAMTSDNPEASGLWEAGYTAINQANLVLSAIDQINDPNLTDALAAQLRGQSLFIRGSAHFELVRYFGKPYGASSGSDLGIPIMTVAVADFGDVTFPARASVEAVYQQAITDLQAAADILPADFIVAGRANRFAALGYLAEIAFQQERYADAANLAGQVINGPFSLTAEPGDPFTSEGSSEEIWAVVNTVQDNPGVNGSLTTFHHFLGRGGDVIASDDLIQNAFGAIVTDEQRRDIEGQGLMVTDLRLTQLYSNADDTSPNVFTIEKYEDFTNNSDDGMMQRLAEYILMRAEALARTQGINDESISLLNQIRARALSLTAADGTAAEDTAVLYEAGDFASADALIEAIILERRVELAFEGNRLHDLKRLKRDIAGLPFDDDKLVLPIPQRDMDANSMLVQNPGY